MYSVFGGRFRSELAFADLVRIEDAAATADWELRVSDGPAPERAGMRQLGTDHVTTRIMVTLHQHQDGMRLVFDDTGVFDVIDEGRTLVWYRREDAVLDAVRTDVLGRVLPLALHVGSVFTLHGSAVRLNGGVVAFLAPKRHGKSTLACALAAAGGELLSDDAVPVLPSDAMLTVPGVRRARLWRDSLDRLGATDVAIPAPRGEKLLLRMHDDEADRMAPTPLVGIYLLSPVPPEQAEAAAKRVQLSERDAMLALITQMKLGTLLGGEESVRVLGFCACLAARVPVYRLEVVRDFAQLDDVVATISEWHDAGRAVPVGA